MQAIISPGKPAGSITPPASKSMMQRACAAALLHTGKTIVNNPGISDDDKAALTIIRQLGAHITQTKNYIEITSHGINPADDIISCHESGLSARLFIPIAALFHQQLTITGAGSLLTRPMDVLTHTLPQLGVNITSNNDYLPISIKGPLHPKDISIDGSVSSQFLTGMLFAYTFSAKETVTLTVNHLNSKPYTDLTLDVLRRFGKNITNNNYESFTIHPQPALHDDVEITIEADWSAASNFVVADAMAGGIDIKNLNTSSLQADSAILQVVNKDRNAFNFDATDCPDLIPILAVYAGTCSGSSNIHGINRLIHKESNRITSTTALLNNLGVECNVEENKFKITGVQQFKKCTVESYNDHRIVMAAAVAALYADGDVIINHAEAVSKSYPDFFKDLAALGVKCNLNYE